jgi:NADH:ubiquinone oxidoreductase subunit C
MSAEENIKQELIKKFKLSEDAFRIPRPRRIFIDVPAVDLEKVFVYAKNELKFGHLVSITGFDDRTAFSCMYHLAHDNGVILNLKISVSKENPVIRSVTRYFAGADIYERELVDLFGIKVEGLAEGNRYPLSDDWPLDQHPLRKDWKSTRTKEGGA